MRVIRKCFEQRLTPLYSLEEIGQLHRWVITHLTGWSYTHYLLNRSESLPATLAVAAMDMLERLAEGEPIQYIVGQCDFYGRSFSVAPGVLIPRPETEELIRYTLQRLPSDRALRMLDIGTGSGAIALSLSLQRPESTMEAWDISDDALAIARSNAAKLGATVAFRRVDVLDLSIDLAENSASYDLIISNPPYICHNERVQMHTNVLAFEPALALFVPDDDPLLFYRTIGYLGCKHLALGALLAFEINALYAVECVQMLEAMGYCQVEVVDDLQQRPRMLFAIR